MYALCVSERNEEFLDVDTSAIYVCVQTMLAYFDFYFVTTLCVCVFHVKFYSIPINVGLR